MSLLRTVVCLYLLGVSLVRAEPQGTVTISAASSCSEFLLAAHERFQKTPEGANVSINFNFAGSGVLLRQIEYGAEMDVYISASPIFIDQLIAKRPSLGRVSLYGNRLVLVGENSLTDIESLKAEEVRFIALANPMLAPIGAYAQRWLKEENSWEVLQSKFTYPRNVLQGIEQIKSGNAEAGFIYQTDVVRLKKQGWPLHVIAVQPEALARDVRVELVLMKEDSPVVPFIAWLSSEEGMTLAKEFGFRPLKGSQ